MKRREFLTRSVGAGAASVLAPAAVLASAGASVVNTRSAVRSSLPASSPMSQAWFEQFVDETFSLVREGGQPLKARLVAVNGRPSTNRVEQFSAAFRVTDGDGLGGLYSVEHAKAGRFELLLSPTADRGPRQTWQAHFSLLT